MTFLTHLECTRCGETYSADTLRTTCPKDGKPLYPRYDLESARRSVRREELAGRVASLWRYRELLPLRDDANLVTLGEGWTPTFGGTSARPSPRSRKASSSASRSAPIGRPAARTSDSARYSSRSSDIGTPWARRGGHVAPPATATEVCRAPVHEIALKQP